MGSVNNTSLVTPYRGGRLGNAMIHTYKAFWFACVHGIPLRNVALYDGRGLASRPLFSRLASRFMDKPSFDSIKFNVSKDCGVMPTREARNALFDMEFGGSDNVSIIHASLYPELPWEKALFISLFDNPGFRGRLAHQYREVLGGNTVGYTIRRTDTLSLHNYNVLTETFIVADMRRTIDRYHGMVRFVVASDDIPFVKSLVAKYPDVGRHIFILDADEDVSLYVLSMCDSVVSNGELQCGSSWVNIKWSMFCSTFGQMAQLLNRSYRYAGMPLPPSCDFSRIDEGIGLSGDIPAELAASRDGDTCDYPPFIER